MVKFFRSVWVTAAAPVLAPAPEESLFPPPKTVDETMIKRQLNTNRNLFIFFLLQNLCNYILT
jgi:hypothetical protein